MARSRGMKRLADVYGVVERMRSVDVQVATGLMTEADGMCVKERQARDSEMVRGRAALAAGDSAGWVISEAERRAAEARLGQLVDLQRQRRVVCEDARNAHTASRINVEQVQRVLDQARGQQELVEQRRGQAESDDRFASQQCWQRKKLGQH